MRFQKCRRMHVISFGNSIFKFHQKCRVSDWVIGVAFHALLPTRLYAIHIIVSGRDCIMGGYNSVPKVQRIVSVLNGFPLLTQMLDEFLVRICR